MSVDRDADDAIAREWKRPGKAASARKKKSAGVNQVEEKKIPAKDFDYQQYAQQAFDHISNRFDEQKLTGEDFDLFFKHSLPWMERIQEIEFERAVPSAKPEHYLEYLRKWMRAWEEVFKRHREYKSGVLK